MIVDYVGALNTYVLLVYFKLGGISVAVMRLWPITVGALIVWFTYRLGLVLCGRRGAWLAAFLLAVQPSHIFFSRQGIYVTNTTIALSLAIWLALWQLMHQGRLRWWYLVAFCAGLGLWAKFIMLWPLAATVVLAPVVWVGRQRLGLNPAPGFRPRLLLHPKTLLIALTFFLIGFSPFLLFNVQTGATFAHFLSTINRSYYGVENAAYLTNLATRWGQLGDYVRGDHFWYLGGNFADVLAWPAWIAGLGLALVLLLWRRRPPCDRTPCGRCSSMPSSSSFCCKRRLPLLRSGTPTSPSSRPTWLWRQPAPGMPSYDWRRVESLRSATAMLAIVLGVSSLRADVYYHRALTATGGVADHSDASYRLADVLLALNINQPYALDWGFDAPLILISKGAVNPIELFGYDQVDAPDPGFGDRLRPLLRDPNAVFLLHAPGRTNFLGRRETLETVAAESGIQLETIAVIEEGFHAPHTEVLRAVRGEQK